MMRAVALMLLAVSGCAAEDPPIDAWHPMDRVPLGPDGKADGAYALFDFNRLVSDAAFVDELALSAADVQLMLETTPYGTRSFLADEIVDAPAGPEPLSTLLVNIARLYQLNPLVLLATLQKETGLVSAEARPGATRVNFALGCGCHDGASCMAAYGGFFNQLMCAAELLRHSFDMGTARMRTRGGYEVATVLTSLDGREVFLANRATLSLYTYSPWVESNQLFRSIWGRYAVATDYLRGFEAPFNEGFIGGACAADADCLFSTGYCFMAGAATGTCTQPCDRFCPDRTIPGFATTFCTTVGGVGLCSAQCDTALAPDQGCPGFQLCAPVPRHLQPAVVRDVCLF